MTGGGRADHHAVPVPRGGVARPLGFEEVREKGRVLAGAALGAGFDGLVGAIERLERLPSVEGLAAAVLDASPGAGLR